MGHIFAISDQCLEICANTYKLKVSLYFGDQLWAFVLVICLRRLPERWGPIKFISTNGLNACVLGHFKSLAATTSLRNKKILASDLLFKDFIHFIPIRFCYHVFTFDCYFMFPCSGMCVEINLDRNFSGAAFLRLRSIWNLQVCWSMSIRPN